MEKFFYVLKVEGEGVGPPYYASLDEAVDAATKASDETFKRDGLRYQVVVLEAVKSWQQPEIKTSSMIDVSVSK